MIPERLKDLRVERGLTLEQLAEATGLSKTALGSYEANDYKDISPHSIVTLAKLECTITCKQMLRAPILDVYGLPAGHLRNEKSPRHRPYGSAFG